jgi:hypothetical protein
MVSDVRFPRERDRDHFLRLVVVERLKHEPVEVFDIDGSADSGGGTFGQVISWRITACQRFSRSYRARDIGDASWDLAHEWRLRTWRRAAGEGK